jgi:hypothetical protein
MKPLAFSIIVAVAALASACATPAPASSSRPPPSSQALFREVSALGDPCMRREQVAALDTQQQIVRCEAALAGFDGLLTRRPDASPFDRSMHAGMKSMVQGKLASLYTISDGRRTMRACEMFEQAWVSRSHVNIADVAPLADSFGSLSDTLVTQIRPCRAMMGAPPGAPPIPE